MEFHCAFGHPGEEITRNTAKMAGIRLIGEWQQCIPCSEARVRRYSVPKTTETRAKSRAGRFYVDLAGPFPEPSLSGNRYTMLCVDAYSRFKIVRFLKHKNQVAGALEDIIASHISPAGLKIGIIRTDGGGEFAGEFQDLLNRLGIKHEKTPPHTPQYNGVTERALGILRDKTVALLRDLKEEKNKRLWAGAMNTHATCPTCASHHPSTKGSHRTNSGTATSHHSPGLFRLAPWFTCGATTP